MPSRDSIDMDAYRSPSPSDKKYGKLQTLAGGINSDLTNKGGKNNSNFESMKKLATNDYNTKPAVAKKS